MAMRRNDGEINFSLEYPYNDLFDYETQLERIDLDKERSDDIKSGKGFIIDAPKSIKKDVKLQQGIFSNRYGNTLHDADSYNGKYRCDCGFTKGASRHGEICETCGTMVKYRDDDVTIFGYMVLKEAYRIIHPNLFRSLEAFIGVNCLNRIIEPEINVDQDGRIIETEPTKKKKDEPFKGIGLIEFRNRFEEIMSFYLKKFPNKRHYYNDIMSNKNIVFTCTIPVYSALLRPSKLDTTGGGGLKYEVTNENYNLLSALVYRCNDDRLHINRKKKEKYQLMYDIQYQFNEIYAELKEVLAHKKGDLRSSLGGRYSFSARCVIKQGTDLKPDQVRLPYHALCELLQQVIINILQKSYNFLYADAYKKWYKAQITFDQVVYDIIDGLIKASPEGLDVLINRNPTINFGSILAVKVIGINMDYTMSVSLQVLKIMGADFDGDSLNVLYLYNRDFIEAAQIMSPRQMFISKNDGRCNEDMIHARDTIINANALKSLGDDYTEEELAEIYTLMQSA